MLRSSLLALLVIAPTTLAVAPAPATDAPGGGVSGPLREQLVIAHRGASAYRPEHTFAAYDLAVVQGTDMLECDLQLTADEVLVCVHDTTVDRTSDGSGRVDSFTLAELRELDFGGWFGDGDHAGQRIVAFEEQLDCYLRQNPLQRFHVETKGPDTYGGRMEELVVELLERKGLDATGDEDTFTSTVLIQSFDPATLDLVDELSDSLPTVLLYPSFSGTPSQPLLEANALFPLGLLPDFADGASPNSTVLRADPTLVDRFHLNGHEVHTYTVNDRASMDALLDQGIDGIFTNNPDVLREAIDARGTGTTLSQRGPSDLLVDECVGIAGRVTGPDGPGDVFAPADEGRGVELIEEATTTAPFPVRELDDLDARDDQDTEDDDYAGGLAPASSTRRASSRATNDAIWSRRTARPGA